MLALTKSVFGCSVLGTVVLLFLQTPIAGRQFDEYGFPSSDSSQILVTVSSQADSMLREAATEIPANLHSYSVTAGAFVRGNATTARLQLESMKGTLASISVRDWLPRGPNWVQDGFQQAYQFSHSKTNVAAGKMPIVTMVKADMNHMADTHPIFKF